MEQALIKLGLSEKEAKVYLATLELGEDTVQNIAKKSGVNRATTYVILEKLMGLGLASMVEHDKKTKFIAESPTELVNILEEQKRQIDSRRQSLDGLMSQLMAVYNSKKGKPIVRYFEGKDGLQALDRYGMEQIPRGGEILSIIPIDIIEEKFSARRQEAVSERVKKGIKTRTIYTHKNGRLPDDINQKELREAVFVTREKLPLTATVQIYPTWGIKFFNFTEGKYFGVLVQSPEFAENMRLIFDLTWAGARELDKSK